MPTTTSNYGLTKPDAGQLNWASQMNTNLDNIDAMIAAGGGQCYEVPFSSSAVFDRSKGPVQHLMLTGNVYTPTFISPQNGLLIVVLQQDSSGGHEFTFPSGVFKGATNITTANGLTGASTYSCQIFAYIPSSGYYVAVAPLIYGV
jgi:hypothetical protein